jgi:excinuclease ABC subunit C
MTYRRGLLLGKNLHVVPSFGEAEEQIVDLIEQYYASHDQPKEVVARLPFFKEELREPLYEGLTVTFPQRGALVDLVNLAELNARQGLDAHFLSARLEDDNLALLEELGKLLEIETPYRIELFDNSHLQGSSPVGAMVCYINGEPAKKMYRKFHLDEADAGDDYHSMKEITYRRYLRLKGREPILPRPHPRRWRPHPNPCDCQEALDAVGGDDSFGGSFQERPPPNRRLNRWKWQSLSDQ